MEMLKNFFILKQRIPFKDIPDDLMYSFIQKVILNFVISLVAVTFSIVDWNKTLIFISAIIFLALSFASFILYVHMVSGNIMILDATVEQVEKKPFKWFKSEESYTVMMRNEQYIYSVVLSRKIARKLIIGIQVRVYVSRQNVYANPNGLVSITSPILITPIYHQQKYNLHKI